MADVFDITKSLNSLTYNNGCWKSPRQGAFLINQIKTLDKRYTTAPTEAQAKALPLVVGGSVYLISISGSYKGNSFGTHYIVDNAGLVLKGTHKYAPDPKLTPSARVNKTTFIRPSKSICEPIVTQAKNITPQNQNTINIIKGLSQQTDFTQSLISTLEAGRNLSPKQMSALQNVFLREKYPEPPRAAEIRRQAELYSVNLQGLTLTSTLDKRKAMSMIDNAKKKGRVASERLSGIDGCYMSKQNLRATINHIQSIYSKLEVEPCSEDWVDSKIAHAHAVLQAVAEYLTYGRRH